MNEKYIAENLCVNKNKPKCCCHGKCYLKKRLDNDEKGDAQGLPQKGKEKIDIQLFFQKINPTEIIINKESSGGYSFLLSFTPQSFYKGCFKPPQIIS